MGARAQITVVLLSLWEGDEVSGVAWASRGSRLSGGIIGEAKLQEEEAAGGAAREGVGDSETCINDETMSLVWAMPPLSAASLVHMERLVLAPSQKMRPKNMLILRTPKRKEVASRVKSSTCRGKQEPDQQARDGYTWANFVHGRRSRSLSITLFSARSTYYLFLWPTSHYGVGGHLHSQVDVELPNFQSTMEIKFGAYFHTYDFNMSDKVGAIWIRMDASWWKAGIQAVKKSWLPAGEIVGPVFIKCGHQLGGPAGGSVPALWRCI
ncbi:hypothetical protein C8J57DRAFT_1233440 [Mycena rebaudengoi]|nr:hypothetical protein C8J57DRAFT_1233440 [Mycena rebaudengoi]